MKISKYTLAFEKDDHTSILYNSLSNAIIELPNEVLDANAHESLLTADEQNLMYKMRMFEQCDDQDKMVEMLQDRKTIDHQLNIWLYITMNCNLRCDYCYEHQVYSKTSTISSMSFEYIERFVYWCSDYVKMHSVNNLSITLTGGEPTIYLSGLNHLMKMFDAASLLNICHFTLITNGYYITDEVMMFIIKYIDSIQITLDGPKEIHDQRRISCDGQPTFKTILRNIIRIKSKKNLQMIVRVNIDSRNMDYIKNLLPIIDKYGLKKMITLNFGDVLSSNQTEQIVFKKILDVYDYSIQNGYQAVICETTPCPITNSGWFAVTPDGNIFKCTGMIDIPSCAVGNIFISEWNEEYYRQLNSDVWKSCLDCEVVGICSGGCNYRSYIAGHPDKKNCRKRYLIEVLKRQVIQSAVGEEKNEAY